MESMFITLVELWAQMVEMAAWFWVILDNSVWSIIEISLENVGDFLPFLGFIKYFVYALEDIGLASILQGYSLIDIITVCLPAIVVGMFVKNFIILK